MPSDHPPAPRDGAAQPLPARAGARPRTNHGMPHAQLDQTAPPSMQEALFARAAALPGVSVGRSLVSVPGARAFHLDAARVRGPTMTHGEFAHLHPSNDGSLHLSLPPALAREACAQGWAEPHPIAALRGDPSLVMVYGPRDEAELEVVWALVRASWAAATGE